MQVVMHMLQTSTAIHLPQSEESESDLSTGNAKLVSCSTHITLQFITKVLSKPQDEVVLLKRKSENCVRE
jgi:hypothetical protein